LTYWKTDSDESIEFNLPEKPSFLSRVLCRKDEVNKSALKRSTRIESDHNDVSVRKAGIQINPWTLIQGDREDDRIR